MKSLLEYNKKLKIASRDLRCEMTDAERLLWRKIRCRQINSLQFYRQKPIGDYIVDFYCSKAKLIIEIDGGQHYEDENLRKEELRSKELEKFGLKILRFTNVDILKNIDAVVNEILEEV